MPFPFLRSKKSRTPKEGVADANAEYFAAAGRSTEPPATGPRDNGYVDGSTPARAVPPVAASSGLYAEATAPSARRSAPSVSSLASKAGKGLSKLGHKIEGAVDRGVRGIRRSLSGATSYGPALSSSHGRAGEDDSEFEAGNSRWKGHDLDVTHQATRKERQQQRVKLSKGAATQRGDVLDTTGGTRTAVVGGAKNQMEGGQIFTMDDVGQFRVADQGAEEQAHGERFHHSSFNGGRDVAAAGEMRVREGQVEAISDRSGHYMPNLANTFDAVKRLEAGGVAPEALQVQLGQKADRDSSLNITATELYGYERGGRSGAGIAETGVADLGYRGYRNTSDAERSIRSNHAKKDGVMRELTSTMATRRAELDASAVGPKDDDAADGADAVDAVDATDAGGTAGGAAALYSMTPGAGSSVYSTSPADAPERDPYRKVAR